MMMMMMMIMMATPRSRMMLAAMRYKRGACNPASERAKTNAMGRCHSTVDRYRYRDGYRDRGIEVEIEVEREGRGTEIEVQR
jgi:hypothetical protein